MNKEHLNIETSLLKVMQQRQAFEEYSKFIDARRLLPNTALLLKDYKKYFDLYPERKEIEFGEFYTHFSQEWHNKDLDNTELGLPYYTAHVFPAIEKCPEEAADKCLLSLLEKSHVNEMEKLLHENADVLTIREKLNMYEEQVAQIKGENKNKDEGTISSVDFTVLDKTHGIPWFLPTLNKGLMTLTMGQFVVVAADSNSGKSAFVLEQAVETIKYLRQHPDKGPILYFNSEGTEADVYARLLSCLYKDKIPGGFEEIVDRIEEVRERFSKAFPPTQLRVFQMATIPTFDAVKRKVLQYNPCLVIVDISDKLAENENVENLKRLYDNFRVLSGITCPIIGTSQSGDTSYYDEKEMKFKNTKWVPASKTYGSKTGKQGSADTIITIGKENEESMLRYISTPKKKRGEAVRIVCELIEKYSSFKELTY